MKQLFFLMVFGCLGILSMAQPAHPILSSMNLYQQDDIVVLRWVIRGGNTCNGMTIFRGENEVEFQEVGDIPGICGSTDSDETYEFVDSNAVANIWNYYQVEFGVQGLSRPIGIFFKQFGEDDVLVLPDPLNDRARILFDNEGKNEAILRVVDRNGSLQDVLSGNSEELTVDMSGWKDGLYYFQLVLNAERKSGKLFKF